MMEAATGDQVVEEGFSDQEEVKKRVWDVPAKHPFGLMTKVYH